MNKNRDKGHRYERKLANLYSELTNRTVTTSRYSSREEDDNGVDLVGTPHIAVQAKATAHTPHKALLDMETDKIKVLHWNAQKEHSKNYVILLEKDWMHIYKNIFNKRKLNLG